MRISELSRRSGAPVSTLKYFLREGLLREGERLSGNQTSYDESHVQRVQLVRALLETGGLSISAAKRVLATLDDESTSLAHTFEAAQHALGIGRGGSPRTAASDASRERVARLTADRSWQISPENPGLEISARVLDGLAAIGHEPSDAYLAAYAAAADTIADADLEALRERESPDLVAELMVVGTVLGDTLIAGLRRLAQESATEHLFPVAGTGADAQPPGTRQPRRTGSK
jgi:DNA-binding transcriptional MerR regulator